MKKLLISFRGILKAFLSLILNYSYDAVRFSRYSCVFGVRTKAQLEARIIATYHTIEKAFSLPQVRVGFGKRKAQNLINLLLRFNSKNTIFLINITQLRSVFLKNIFSFVEITMLNAMI